MEFLEHRCVSCGAILQCFKEDGSCSNCVSDPQCSDCIRADKIEAHQEWSYYG